MPTSREKIGDFSRSVKAAGNLVVIYDPLTTRLDPTTGLLIRDPFPGDMIPTNRLNPVAQSIARFYPAATRDVSDGSSNFRTTADQTGFAIVANAKIDHRFSDKVSLSGFYSTNKTSQTNENFWERGQGASRFADPRDGTLDRSLHLLAVNNMWIPGNSTVLTLRYGSTHLQDDDSTTIDFDPASLGFDAAYLNAAQVRKFPGRVGRRLRRIRRR